MLEDYFLKNGWIYRYSTSIPDNFKTEGIIIDNNYTMIAITKTTYAAHSNDK